MPSTGLSGSQVLDVCEQVVALAAGHPPAAGSRALGLYQYVKLVLLALRHNLTQELLAELLDVSQPTVSRVISTYTPLLARALEANVPTVEDLDPATTLVIDGTVLACWDWRDHPELCSGEYRRTGLNVQVACTLSGSLAWVSDPLPGSVHDATAIRAYGLLDASGAHLPPGTDPPRHIGDKGYIGLGMITPVRKPPGRTLHQSDKTHNTSINTIRYVVERTIVNIKTRRVLHTGYRRPIQTFPTTITAVLGIIITYTHE